MVLRLLNANHCAINGLVISGSLGIGAQPSVPCQFDRMLKMHLAKHTLSVTWYDHVCDMERSCFAAVALTAFLKPVSRLTCLICLLVFLIALMHDNH